MSVSASLKEMQTHQGGHDEGRTVLRAMLRTWVWRIAELKYEPEVGVNDQDGLWAQASSLIFWMITGMRWSFMDIHCSIAR